MSKWFNDLKLQNKFIATFVVIIVVAAMALGWNIFSLRQIDTEFHDTVMEAEELIALQDVQIDLLKQELQEKDFLLTGDPTYIENHQEFERRTDEQFQQILSLARENEQAAIRALMSKKDEYEETFDGIVTLYNEGNPKEAVNLALQSDDLDQVQTQVEALIEAGEQFMAEEATQADQQTQTATLTAIAGLVLAVVLGIGISIFLTRSINKPLDVIVRGANILAAGDIEAMGGIDEATINAINARQDEMGTIGRAFSALRDYMQKMAGAATRMAQGDLIVEVPPQSDKDVLGNAFAQMIADLRILISQVQQSAVQVAEASEQLSIMADQTGHAGQQVASTIQQVAQGNTQQTHALTEATGSTEQIANAANGIARGAQEQAQAVQRTSDLINEMAAIVNQVGEATNSVTGATTKVTQAAHQGVTAIEQTSQGMDTIRTRSSVAAEKVREMSVRSREIGRIVETIDDIADKTDMLALNAAVEAARAGDHGRGFAVVADQVRKLSEDSKEATRDIDALIERVQETVNEAIAAIESTVTEVEGGTRLAKDTTQSLQDILRVAEEAAAEAETIYQAVTELKQKNEGVVEAGATVSAVVEENTAVAEELAANTQEVTTAMESVAGVAEENSAAAEEVSASAEEMSAQIEEVVASAEELSALAEQLQTATAQFKVTQEQVGQKLPGGNGRSAYRQKLQLTSPVTEHKSNGTHF